MDVLLLMVSTFVGYIFMYQLYGKFIGRKIFALSDKARVPSVEFRDDTDYVPTKKGVIFGFHFTAIAGTGPIVGPAVGIIWGWLPALLWVFVGSIFIGGIHDLGSLILSMRNQGKSISDYTANYISARSRFLFFLVVAFGILNVLAVFGLIIAIIFSIYPESVLPIWSQVFIALLVGHVMFKKGGNPILWTVIAVILMYISIILGAYLPINMIPILGIPATGVWTIFLLLYAFIASVLPVTVLVQSRGFINAYQLVIVMGLLLVGVVFSGVTGRMELVAPMVQLHPADAPPIWPFLFIVIACGAVSGFHSLVASGASSKQVACEPDALLVGYGSMLMEGSLAILVIISVAAGIGMGYQTSSGETLVGTVAWTTHYSSWSASSGLASKLTAFAEGSANIIASLGIPKKFAMVIMGAFIASFAATTLDASVRIQRYVLSELFSSIKLNILTNKYLVTSIAVGSAIFLAFASGASGKGALTLWPLFGAINQTIAALALVVITIYLKEKGGKKWLISGIPAAFMLVVSSWSTVLNQFKFMENGLMTLSVINVVIMFIVIWVVIEAGINFFRIDEK